MFVLSCLAKCLVYLYISNSFHNVFFPVTFLGSSKDECVPFNINNTQVGLVPPEVLNKLEFYHDIFYVVRDLLSKKIKYVTMATTLTDKKTRSQQFANVMRDWKDRNLFPTLKGWRNEVCVGT